MQDENLQNTNPVVEPAVPPTQPVSQPTSQSTQQIEQPVTQQMPPIITQQTTMQSPQSLPQTPQLAPTQTADVRKWVRYTGITSIVMGIASIMIAGFIGYYYDVNVLLDVGMGMLYLILGLRLTISQLSIKSTLFVFKILALLILIGLAFAVLARKGPGLINTLILFFTLKSVEKMFKGGLITSQRMFSAKPTQK